MRIDRLDKVCDALLGSTISLEQGLEENGIMEESVSIDEHQYIDSRVMCCDKCGEWAVSTLKIHQATCQDCIIGEEY